MFYFIYTLNALVAMQAVFDRDPLQKECLALRRWDEGAKRPDWNVPDMESYKERVMACIVHLGSEPGVRPGTFIREGNTVMGLVQEPTEAEEEEKEPK